MENTMENDIFNILMVGVGGQGIITASDILTLTAMYSGYDAKKSEIHGMSQRGGSVFSHIRFGKKVYSPIISMGEADILFSLEEMETLRWINYAGPRTIVITLRTRINPSGVDVYPEGVEEELQKICTNLKFLAPDELKKDVGSVRYLNVALLGVISRYVDFPEHAWEKAIRECVPEGTFDPNWKAFIAGKSF